MTTTTIISMMSLSLAMSISPGPVNMLSISSGINNGFKKTFGFVSGATIGFTFLLICMGLGIITIIDTYPMILKILSIIGSLFIMYMGYKIAMSSSKVKADKENKIPKFYEGFLLQWLNPKAWIACVAGTSLFSHSSFELFTFIVIYFFICYASISFWALFGHHATKFLNNDFKLKVFNITMGSFLILPTGYIIVGLLSSH